MATSSSPALKVVFGNEIRRFSLTETSYACLVRTVCAIFQTSPHELDMSYIDEEGDHVRITSDAELNFALKHLQNKLKIVLTASKPSDVVAVPSINQELAQTAERPPHQRKHHQHRSRHSRDESSSTKLKIDASSVVGEFFVVEGKVENQQKTLSIQPGAKFSKVFTVKNESHLPWPADTKVTFIKGDQEVLNVPASIAIPRTILPKEEFNVVVCGTAPQEPGKYFCLFRLASADGDLFGRRLKFAVQVETQEKKNDVNEVTEDMLNQLTVMGFSNEALNKRLIKQKKGDLEKVLDMLAVIESNKDKKKKNVNKH